MQHTGMYALSAALVLSVRVAVPEFVAVYSLGGVVTSADFQLWTGVAIPLPMVGVCYIRALRICTCCAIICILNPGEARMNVVMPHIDSNQPATL